MTTNEQNAGSGLAEWHGWSKRSKAILIVSIFVLITFYIGSVLLKKDLKSHIEIQELRCKIQMKGIVSGCLMYETVYGVSPFSGSNLIWKTLLGENTRRVAFLDIQPHMLNPLGEYLDPWKTAYKVRPLPDARFLVKSAGPNRKFGDADDISLDGSFVPAK